MQPPCYCDQFVQNMPYLMKDSVNAAIHYSGTLVALTNRFPLYFILLHLNIGDIFNFR